MHSLYLSRIVTAKLVLKSSGKYLTELFVVEMCCLYVLPVCIPLLGLSTHEGEGAIIDQNMGNYALVTRHNI